MGERFTQFLTYICAHGSVIFRRRKRRNRVGGGRFTQFLTYICAHGSVIFRRRKRRNRVGGGGGLHSSLPIYVHTVQ